jgi:hypothetical protein
VYLLDEVYRSLTSLTLHERITSEDKNTPFYDKAVQTHAKFHNEAGTILELGLQGRSEEANERMKIGGEFAALSGELTRIMMEWKSTL